MIADGGLAQAHSGHLDPLTWRIGDVTVDEGGNAVFTVTLNRQSFLNQSVRFATGGGTATTGEDYSGHSGTLTIPAGSQTGVIVVQTVEDALEETDETFDVTLLAPSWGTLADALGRGTIADDTETPADETPLLSIADSTPVPEGADHTFGVALSAPSATSVVIEVRTSDGSATADTDYGRSTTLVAFAPGQTLRTLPPIKTFDDALDEENETFHVLLEIVVGDVALPDGQAVGTIVDGDDPPALRVGSASVIEGGGPTFVSFEVGLSAQSGKTVSVGFETADGTATQPGDYTPASGTLTFAPGELSKTFRVDVRGDTDTEPGENFTVRLRDAANASIAAATGTGTIVDDDTATPPPPVPAPPPPPPPTPPPSTRRPTAVPRQAGVVCTKVGTAGRDVILGTPRRDVICGLGGADTLVGLGGNDMLVGGPGHDILLGGGGHDRLLGGAGRDRLLAGAGNDRMVGGAGNDVLDGGLGGDRADGGRGNDLLLGRGGRDTLLGARGRDRLRGGTGIDRLDGGPGADSLDGGPGRDRCLSGAGSTSCL